MNNNLTDGGTYLMQRIRARCEMDGCCWIWKGNVTAAGNPQMWIGPKTAMVRREAWKASGRELLSSRYHVIVPECDAYACVNPACMRQITKKEYQAELADKGVYSRPAPARTAALRRIIGKLDIEKAREIRASEESVEALAQKHGTHPSTINRVRRHDIWREASPFAGLLGARA